jgi:hypothetical protein
MYYVLLDSTGNLLASYRHEDEAHSMLAQLIEADPEAADEIALMTYGDEGESAADPIFLVTTEAAAASVDVASRWYSSSSQRDLEGGRRTEGRTAIPTSA